MVHEGNVPGIQGVVRGSSVLRSSGTNVLLVGSSEFLNDEIVSRDADETRSMRSIGLVETALSCYSEGNNLTFLNVLPWIFLDLVSLVSCIAKVDGIHVMNLLSCVCGSMGFCVLNDISFESGDDETNFF